MQNFGLHIFNFWTPHFSVWTWPRLPPALLPPPPTVTGEVADNHADHGAASNICAKSAWEMTPVVDHFMLTGRSNASVGDRTSYNSI